MCFDNLPMTCFIFTIFIFWASDFFFEKQFHSWSQILGLSKLADNLVIAIICLKIKVKLTPKLLSLIKKDELAKTR